MSDLTLASVEEAFQQWRAGRHSRAELIPEALWSMALRLYPQYQRSKICRYLQLSGGQFKKRLDNDRGTQEVHTLIIICLEKKQHPEKNSFQQLKTFPRTVRQIRDINIIRPLLLILFYLSNDHQAVG